MVVVAIESALRRASEHAELSHHQDLLRRMLGLATGIAETTREDAVQAARKPRATAVPEADLAEVERLGAVLQRAATMVRCRKSSLSCSMSTIKPISRNTGEMLQKGTGHNLVQ